MKRLSSAPCQEWADKLLASYTDALPLSEYLVLKEHLLACPACAETHNRYLLIEAQIRNLPVLHPRRQLSAAMLTTKNEQRKNVQHATHQGWTSIFAANSRRLLNPIAPMRRPVYALVALLFCLLATAAGAGTVNYALHQVPIQQTHTPRLSVATTGLALAIITTTSSDNQFVHSDIAQQPLLATGTLMLRNIGESTLTWKFESARSVIVYMPGSVRLWTNPAQGTLDRNEDSLIQVMANGINDNVFSLKRNVELGSIFFTSNGGDAMVHATLQSTAPSTLMTPTQKYVPQSKQSALLAPLPAYIFKKQHF